MKVGLVLLLPYGSLIALSGPAAPVQDPAPTSGLPEGALPVSPAMESGGALFTRVAIEERASAWEPRALEACGWRLLLSERCAVRSNVLLGDLRATAVHADAFIAALERALGGDSRDLRFSIRVFRHRHAFDLYAAHVGAAGAESFYDVRNAEAVLYWPDRGGPWRSLMHELCHAYMDRVFDRRGPLWLVEGLAEHFAGYRVERGALRFGVATPGQLRALREASERGEIVALGPLLASGREAFYGERHALYYAQAASLVRMLADGQFEDHPDVLHELVRGKDLRHFWNLESLERRWREALRKDLE